MKPSRLHFIRKMRRPAPVLREVDDPGVRPGGIGGLVEIEIPHHRKSFRSYREAALFEKLAGGALSHGLAGFYFAAEAIPFAVTHAAAFPPQKNAAVRGDGKNQ
ncbi:Uncharacterised protein [Bacteroides xylanisolvens]|nr:Uncharacterised protein [Bacteroides xylanisolvens]